MSHLKLKGGLVENVEYEELSTSVLSMTFFDRLAQEGLIAPSGHVRQCMDEEYESKQVCDALADMMVNPDSEHVDLYSSKEKREFIFALLKQCVIGGSMCQPSDQAHEYLDTVKSLYKLLVKIHKSKTGGQPKLQISSRVFQLQGQDLFPKDSPYKSCFLIVDAKLRLITIWYSPYVPFW